MSRNAEDKQPVATESLDFLEIESNAWRKHQHRKYFQEKGQFLQLTSDRIKGVKEWVLIIITGFLIACAGALVIVLTDNLFQWKFNNVEQRIHDNHYDQAFATYLFMNLLYALIAGLLCVLLPPAAGSGIPEIRAFLNGVKLDNALSVPVLLAKAIGMCFSVASSLPLGKEGPMIHVGSIIGGVISQGWPFRCGYDIPWANFRELRNDFTKRDFITIGAAAGVAAAFKAPIGGILFTLEEGASFWSLPLTISAFICAAITQLTISLMFANYTGDSLGSFAFGQFDTLVDGRSNYYTYELLMFIAMGAAGGCLGALFNHINLRATTLRKRLLYPHRWRRILELLTLTLVISIVSFVLPLMWQICTPLPDVLYTAQEKYLVRELVHFQCDGGSYNELASLFLTPADIAMQQLFHMREVDGNGHNSIGYIPLLLFVIPYFFLAAITPGILAPAGLFIPTLFSGAAFGRLVGHAMNYISPGKVADAGTYAFIGSAAMLGGMSRMTISGTVILLEACGNTSYLLPLMVTFAVARYVGNKFNNSLYDTQLKLLGYPFLESELHSIGLINYDTVSKIMATPVITLREIDSVRNVVDALTQTTHNGFPIVSSGKLTGFMLRKTICQLLKLRVFSMYAEGELQSSATVFYDTLDKAYPNFPAINDVVILETDKDMYVDFRSYMDSSPSTVDVACSVQRCYRLFRTMGLRHVVVLDSEHSVKGIITRKDLTEERLEEIWTRENEAMPGDVAGHAASTDEEEIALGAYSDVKPLRLPGRSSSSSALLAV